MPDNPRALLRRLVDALLATEKCRTCSHLIDEEAACTMHGNRLDAALKDARRYLDKPQAN